MNVATTPASPTPAPATPEIPVEAGFGVRWDEGLFRADKGVAVHSVVGPYPRDDDRVRAVEVLQRNEPRDTGLQFRAGQEVPLATRLMLLGEQHREELSAMRTSGLWGGPKDVDAGTFRIRVQHDATGFEVEGPIIGAPRFVLDILAAARELEAAAAG